MSYISKIGAGQHVLYDNDTKKYEVWSANKNHASYGIIYKNTHLEFCYTMENKSTCDHCGGNDIKEILDGQWTVTSYAWDEEKQQYIEDWTRDDGDGMLKYECSDCGHPLDFSVGQYL